MARADAGVRYVAIRHRRSARTLLFLVALRGIVNGAPLIAEAAAQLSEAERLVPTRRPS